ncbi:hypothetical protein [Aquimarina rhabdastrellae]
MRSTNTVKEKKEYMYGIDLMLDLPFELYMDDILVRDSFDGNRTIIVADINEFLLEEGKHQITLKLFPKLESKEDVLKDLVDYRVNLVRWERQRESGLGRAKNFQVLQKFSIKKELPIELKQSWTFQINNLPYKIEGWKNSINLENENRDNLYNEVVTVYKKMSDYLVQGKIEEYIEAKKDFYDEINASEYYTNQEIEEDKSVIKSDLIYWKNSKPLPFENFEMIFYAKGKLVSLRRIDLEYKNFSPVILEKELKEYEDNEYQSFEFLLHRPSENEKLQIIR